mgnify:FL=1
MFTHYNRFDTYATKMSMYGGDGKNKERVIHSFGEKLLTKYSQRSKNNAGKEVSSIEFGILNGGDFFRDGIHNDFFDAQVQYRYTLLNFFKNQVILKAKGNNLVKLWDVIDLVITKSETMQLNETVSGKYVVGGLIHILGEDSEYQTQIVLYRSGINGSELDDEIILE